MANIPTSQVRSKPVKPDIKVATEDSASTGNFITPSVNPPSDECVVVFYSAHAQMADHFYRKHGKRVRGRALLEVCAPVQEHKTSLTKVPASQVRSKPVKPSTIIDDTPSTGNIIAPSVQPPSDECVAAFYSAHARIADSLHSKHGKARSGRVRGRALLKVCASGRDCRCR